ncbi:hypothetical protein D3C87_1893430 [compost metagenome]
MPVGDHAARFSAPWPSTQDGLESGRFRSGIVDMSSSDHEAAARGQRTRTDTRSLGSFVEAGARNPTPPAPGHWAIRVRIQARRTA